MLTEVENGRNSLLQCSTEWKWSSADVRLLQWPRLCCNTFLFYISKLGQRMSEKSAKQVLFGVVEQGRHFPERHKDDLGRRHAGSRGQREGCTPHRQNTVLCVTGEPMGAASLGTVSRYYNHGLKTYHVETREGPAWSAHLNQNMEEFKHRITLIFQINFPAM